MAPAARPRAGPTQRCPTDGLVGAGFGGVVVTRALFGPDAVAAMRAEAARSRAGAVRQLSTADDHADGRGGRPARRLWAAEAGPAQDRCYHDPAIARWLSARSGHEVRPAGGRGSYSYYAGGGDFLDLHRDVPTCDITTITILADASAGRDPRGGLLYYPMRCGEPLGAIRSTPRLGAQVRKPPVGTTLVIAGGEVAHRLLPTAPGGHRIVSVLCFEAVIGRADGSGVSRRSR